MNVLRNIPERIVDEVVEKICKYIWGNNPRIAMDILTALKETGVLRLFDLINKDYTLKVNWIKVFFENQEIRN